MKIMGMGLDLAGRALFPPVDTADFSASLLAGLAENGELLRQVTRSTSRAVAFRSEVQRRVVDPGDPRTAGWIYLVNENDPRREQYASVLQPLISHRNMSVGPLLYSGEGIGDWLTWLDNTFYETAMEAGAMPDYILILGGPDQVPFQFQALLSTAARVGRLAFDTTEALQRYVDKLLRLETAAAPAVTRQVLLFAPDAGVADPTYYSREHMVLPLQDHIERRLGIQTHALLADQATKTNLAEALATTTPALVYTASHGLGAIDQPLARQRQFNGALCCQHQGSLTMDALYSAADIPRGDEPFLEGAVFFQFACFGYGTPAQSDYAHWLKQVPQQYAEQPFVAALPQTLLAHPRGPIAYIGHLDTAFLHAFTDPRNRQAVRSWHGRLQPFRRAIDQILGVQPAGLALQDLNERYNLFNSLLTTTYDEHRRGEVRWHERAQTRFIDTWITRSDAQNYMILGDPAARLRIPAGSRVPDSTIRVGDLDNLGSAGRSQ